MGRRETHARSHVRSLARTLTRTDVDGTLVWPLHESDKAIDEVADVLKGARLRARAHHRHRLALQRLHEKV